MTHDGCYLIVMPYACWHVAANDDVFYTPRRS